MYWSRKKELTPEEVKKLPVGTDVHLEGNDRYGEVTWMEGKIQQSYKKKIFVYRDNDGLQHEKPIRAYPNKKWMVQIK